MSFGGSRRTQVVLAVVVVVAAVVVTLVVVAPGVRAVVAVEVGLGPDPTHSVVPLGSTPDEGPWAGSAWITSDEAPPYLVVAGGNGTERVEVFAGTESAQVTGAGFVAPVVTGTDNFLPDVVVAGFTADGTVVAPMSGP